MSILKDLKKGKINIYEIERKLGLTAIFLLLIDSLNITFLPVQISLFRITCIIFFIIYLIFMFKLKINYYTFLIFLYTLSCFIAYFLSKNKSLSISILLNDIFSIMFIYIALDIYEKDDIPSLLKAIIYSMIFPFIFSVIEYFNFFILGQRVTYISLFGILQSIVSVEDIATQQISGIPRLVFPYSTSPAFSLNVGVGILSIIMLKEFNKKIQFQKGIIFILIVLLILSFSRSTILAMIVAYVVYIFKFSHISRKQARNLTIFFTAFITIFILVLPKLDDIFMFLDTNSKIFHVLLGRVEESNLSSILQGRHVLLMLEGFHILFSNIITLFIGTGTQSIVMMYGKYTLIPYSFLSSHMTILVERGIFGYLSTFMLNFYILFNRKIRNSPLLCFQIYILVSLFLYELRSSLIIPIITSICLLYIKRDRGQIIKIK